MRISNIPPHLLPFMDSSENDRNRTQPCQEQKRDSIEISSAKAHEISPGYNRTAGVSKISDIKAKIENGYYSNPDFEEKLAARLIKHPGFMEKLGFIVDGGS